MFHFSPMGGRLRRLPRGWGSGQWGRDVGIACILRSGRLHSAPTTLRAYLVPPTSHLPRHPSSATAQCADLRGLAAPASNPRERGE